MHKISDIFDILWLNLSIIVGSIAVLIGFLFGWNSCLAWQIVISIYAIGIIYQVVKRAIRIFRQGVVIAKADDFLVIKPEPDHNILKEFLQPISFVIFLALAGSNWAESASEPRWFNCVIIALLIALAFLNFDYYRNRKC